MQECYFLKYNPEWNNWFTDGGCIDNGEENALAAFAIFGERHNIRKSGIDGVLTNKQNCWQY